MNIIVHIVANKTGTSSILEKRYTFMGDSNVVVNLNNVIKDNFNEKA